MKSSQAALSILIKNTPEAIIEQILDEIAQNVHWTNKEIRKNANKKVISYTSQGFNKYFFTFPFPNVAGKKIIECTMSGKPEGIRMDIISKSIITKDSSLLTSSLWEGSILYDYFDFFQQNKGNLDYIYEELRKYLPDKVTIIGKKQNTRTSSGESNNSKKTANRQSAE